MTRISSICLSFLVVFLLHGCAKAPAPEKAPRRPFEAREIDAVLTEFKAQDRMALSCFGSGRLSIKTREGEDSVHILAVGQKNPFRIKLEITHTWGRPILHLLMDESTLKAVVFPHKRVYEGKPTDALPRGALPVPLAPDVVWGLIRGFPVVAGHAGAKSARGGEITLLDKNGAVVEVFTFGSDEGFPVAASFFEHSVDVYYSPFKETDGIQSARLVKLVHSESGTILELELKDRVFNRAIPAEVFQLEIPGGYEVGELSAPTLE